MNKERQRVGQPAVNETARSREPHPRRSRLRLTAIEDLGNGRSVSAKVGTRRPGITERLILIIQREGPLWARTANAAVNLLARGEKSADLAVKTPAALEGIGTEVFMSVMSGGKFLIEICSKLL
jgi:hypothetical protein